MFNSHSTPRTFIARPANWIFEQKRKQKIKKVTTCSAPTGPLPVRGGRVRIAPPPPIRLFGRPSVWLVARAPRHPSHSQMEKKGKGGGERRRENLLRAIKELIGLGRNPHFFFLPPLPGNWGLYPSWNFYLGMGGALIKVKEWRKGAWNPAVGMELLPNI